MSGYQVSLRLRVNRPIWLGVSTEKKSMSIYKVKISDYVHVLQNTQVSCGPSMSVHLLVALQLDLFCHETQPGHCTHSLAICLQLKTLAFHTVARR